MIGLDQSASVEPAGFVQLVDAIRKIELAIGDGVKRVIEAEAPIAKKAKLKVNYTKQIQRYPSSNHLYWLANNKVGGQEWSFLDSKALHHEYEKQLASIGQCDTLMASFSK